MTKTYLQQSNLVSFLLRRVEIKLTLEQMVVSPISKP